AKANLPGSHTGGTMKSVLRESSALPGSFARPVSWLIPAILAQLLMAACSPPVSRPTGPAKDYADAEDLFGKSRYDRALEYTRNFVKGAPGDYNDRGRVLRAIILSGDINSYKELAEAYEKGAESTKNPRYKAEFVRLRHDNLRYAGERSLALGEVA